jgi:ribosomal protein L36
VLKEFTVIGHECNSAFFSEGRGSGGVARRLLDSDGEWPGAGGALLNAFLCGADEKLVRRISRVYVIRVMFLQRQAVLNFAQPLG